MTSVITKNDVDSADFETLLEAIHDLIEQSCFDQPDKEKLHWIGLWFVEFKQRIEERKELQRKYYELELEVSQKH